MKILLLLAATYLVFVLETSLLPLFGADSIRPRLALAALALVARPCQGRTGILIAAGWGLISDGLSRGSLGIDLVAFVVATWVLQVVRSRSPRALWFPGVMTGVVALGVLVVGASARAAIEQKAIQLEPLCVAAMGAAGTTALLATGLLSLEQLFSRRPPDDNGAAAPHVSNRWSMLTE